MLSIRCGLRSAGSFKAITDGDCAVRKHLKTRHIVGNVVKVADLFELQHVILLALNEQHGTRREGYQSNTASRLTLTASSIMAKLPAGQAIPKSPPVDTPMRSWSLST
ncbi:hypothetical protein IB235_16380 [Paracoccus sp. PAR01]|nr:hypothetical protein [Paracoccus sp. PAR01]